MNPWNTHQQGPMPLRPMNFGELLDVGIKTFTKHWGKYLSIGLIATLPTMVYLVISNAFMLRTANFAESAEELFLMDNPFSDPFALIGLFGSAILLWAVTLLLGPLFFGATVHLSSQALLGRTTSMKVSLQAAWSRFGALLGTAVLKGLALSVLPFALLFGPLAWFGVNNAPQALDERLIGYVLLIFGTFLVIALIVGVLNLFGYLTEQAVLLEGLPGGVAPLKRSFSLIGSAFWRSAGMGAILVGMALGVSMLLSVIQIPLMMFVLFAESAGLMFVGQMISGLATVITIPLQYLLLTLFYYDLRMRKEGYDLELQAAQQAESLAAPE